jgi:phage terminase large subunit-like protein
MRGVNMPMGRGVSGSSGGAAQQTLGQSQWAGRPFLLEQAWQAPIMYEALAVDSGNGDPYWKTIVIVLPRKNAKTTTLGAYATTRSDEGRGRARDPVARGGVE